MLDNGVARDNSPQRATWRVRQAESTAYAPTPSHTCLPPIICHRSQPCAATPPAPSRPWLTGINDEEVGVRAGGDVFEHAAAAVHRVEHREELGHVVEAQRARRLHRRAGAVEHVRTGLLAPAQEVPIPGSGRICQEGIVHTMPMWVGEGRVG